MKSAYELAMERLEKASPSLSLTQDQKKEIAEVDSVYRAKIAEKELFLKDQIRKAQTAGKFEEAESLEKQLASEIRRLQKDCEARKESCARAFRAIAKSARDCQVERAVSCALLKFGRRSRQLLWQRLRSSRSTLPTSRQIVVQKAQHVGTLDGADAFLFLQIGNALAKLFHLRPMHFRSEMMLGVIAVVEEEPVIDFSVTAYAPCNRFVGVCAVMSVVAVEITETVTEIPERQEKQHKSPVDEVNWSCRHNNGHHQKCRGECGQFEVAPEEVAVIPLAQFSPDRAHIVSEETKKDVAPRIFRVAVVPVPVNRKPVDRVAVFVLTIRVPPMMLHVDRVIVCL
jgi:hypothetical protein